MASTRYLLLLALAACADADLADEMTLAESDAVAVASSGAADGPSWESAETLHGNATLFDSAGTNGRRVHSLWIAGSASSPVPMTITADAADGHDVRIAILGPLKNGTRPVLAADGYAYAKDTASVTFDARTKGEHLVVVGSYNLATETFYDLSSSCSNCETKVDVLATPKDFALVGNENRLVQMQLGAVMANYNTDIEVEVWASRPMQTWNATKVATSYASGTQVNVILPTSVAAGDDLTLVVREAGGRVLDTGVVARNIRTQNAFVRTDAILYGDLTSLDVSGVVGFFEGQADMRLRSESRNLTLADHTVHADKPGMTGIGFNAFNAYFVPDFSRAARDGELLSVGFINGNGDYSRLACFEYCNNLSGLSDCTGGPRACP